MKAIGIGGVLVDPELIRNYCRREAERIRDNENFVHAPSFREMLAEESACELDDQLKVVHAARLHMACSIPDNLRTHFRIRHYAYIPEACILLLVFRHVNESQSRKRPFTSHISGCFLSQNSWTCA